MDKKTATILADEANKLAEHSNSLAEKLRLMALDINHTSGVELEIFALATFILACFIGYHVASKATGFLYGMLVANCSAITGVIIIGAIIIANSQSSVSTFIGLIAVIMASFTIFAGFIVSYRLLKALNKRDDDL